MSNYVLQNSFDVANVPSHDFSIQQRRTLSVTDNNNKNYNANSILFDLATVSNSNLYPSFREAVLEIPLKIEIDTPAGTATYNEARKLIAGLKNGCPLIDGFNVYLSNMPVVGYQRMNVGKVAYELATNWSSDDYVRSKEWGITFEDGTKWDYDAAASVGATPARVASNSQAKDRYDYVNSAGDKTAVFRDAAVVTKQRVDTFEYTSTKSTINIIAKVSLGHLDDYFRKCPLTKNSLYRMEFFVNTSSFAIVTATATDKYDTLSSMTTSFGFNPIEVSPYTTWNGADASGRLITSLMVKASIGHTITACELVIPMYELSPEAESSYLSDAVKTFNYDKVLFQKLNSVASTVATGNLLISSGTSRARKLVILPFYDNDLTNPFTSFGSGFLSSPFATVSDFNVLVSGIPLFNTNLNTPVEFFKEFKRETLNNGVDDAVLNSSMVDLSQYKSQYGAIVVDLTMNSKEKDDDLSKSYSVTFTNPMILPCSYLCYLYYEATVSINAETGQIVL